RGLMGLSRGLSLVGARVLYLYNNSGEYNWAVFEKWQSGFVLYGGLIAGIAAGLLYIKMRGHSLAPLSDLVAPALHQEARTLHRADLRPRGAVGDARPRVRAPRLLHERLLPREAGDEL